MVFLFHLLNILLSRNPRSSSDLRDYCVWKIRLNYSSYSFCLIILLYIPQSYPKASNSSVDFRWYFAYLFLHQLCTKIWTLKVFYHFVTSCPCFLLNLSPGVDLCISTSVVNKGIFGIPEYSRYFEIFILEIL